MQASDEGSTMDRSWEDNAAEFGALAKQGRDMRLALLVACSVDRASRGRPKIGDRRNKVSASGFAKVAGTTDKRVTRHLDAWDALAARRMVKQAASLKPIDALSYEVSERAHDAFHKVFDASKSGGRPRASVAEIAEAMERADVRDKVARAMKPTAAEAVIMSVAEAGRERMRAREAERRADEKPVTLGEIAGETGQTAQELHDSLSESWADQPVARVTKRVRELYAHFKHYGLVFSAGIDTPEQAAEEAEWLASLERAERELGEVRAALQERVRDRERAAKTESEVG